MNPCPCGNRGSAKRCVCKETDLQKYERKISGPIIDRIDMWVPVGPIDHTELRDQNSKRESAELREKVTAAREIQKKRFRKHSRGITLNSHMNVRDMNSFIKLEKEALDLLQSSAKTLQLSARGYHKVMRLSQTIADLDISLSVKEKHVTQALQYRPRSLFT